MVSSSMKEGWGQFQGSSPQAKESLRSLWGCCWLNPQVLENQGFQKGNSFCSWGVSVSIQSLDPRNSGHFWLPSFFHLPPANTSKCCWLQLKSILHPPSTPTPPSLQPHPPCPRPGYYNSSLWDEIFKSQCLQAKPLRPQSVHLVCTVCDRFCTTSGGEWLDSLILTSIVTIL